MNNLNRYTDWAQIKYKVGGRLKNIHFWNVLYNNNYVIKFYI